MKKFEEFNKVNENVSINDIESKVQDYMRRSVGKMKSIHRDLQQMDNEADLIHAMIQKLVDGEMTTEIDGKLELLMEPFEKFHNMVNDYIGATDQEFIHYSDEQKYDPNV